ncbi:MAG: short-chain dehydrogenase [Myxococcales bacterium]|nr:short-chain dehydrogenase [Myxococcales bacterium]
MSSNTRWTAEQIPEQRGRVVVITGANSGIGLEAARALAREGAHVVLACRNQAKGRDALQRLQRELPDAQLELGSLDLADLASIRAFAAHVRETHERLDLLINNAGVMALPYRKTADGFEMQLGTNHLGHFALTGLLLAPLLNAEAARVVTVSSQAHRVGAIRFSDLHGEQGYDKWRAYGQSKLANLLFAYELQRRLKRAGASAISVACHPGYSGTNLQMVGPQMSGSSLTERIMNLGNSLLAQSAAMGALPTLYAATAPHVRGGDYIGPSGPMEMRGHPVHVASTARSHDRATAQRLWALSEEMTQVRFDALKPPA